MKLQFYYKYNTILTDYYYDKEEGLAVWHQHSFLLLNLFPKNGTKLFKIFHLKYDGVPYRILTVPFLKIQLGKIGYWDMIQKKMEIV